MNSLREFDRISSQGGSPRLQSQWWRRGKCLVVALWVKAQHEGALPPPCIVRKDPRVHSGCEGELGIALESLHGKRDLI